MTQRPVTVPRTHLCLQLSGLRQLPSGCDVPYHDYTLHRPRPRRYLLNTLLTEMLRRFNVDHLFARAEQNLNRPSPGELNNDPTPDGVKIRREQVDIFQLTNRVPYHHDLD